MMAMCERNSYSELTEVALHLLRETFALDARYEFFIFSVVVWLFVNRGHGEMGFANLFEKSEVRFLALGGKSASV